ncbi:MAG TPA: TolC family protein [Acidobacteriaceae bacterium]|jgi:outer membrane protein TolC|nr:TolC family protein [Acidobacteriaceae bacterium]
MFRSGLSARLAASFVAGAVMLCARAAAVDSLPQAPQPTASPAVTNSPAPAITLNQAMALAVQNDPAFATARAAAGSARLDAAISRSALLPNAGANGIYTYTQPSGFVDTGVPYGLQHLPVFVANDSVHEYWAQLLVNQTISLPNIANWRRARAVAGQASADLESARRDLLVRVVAAYFGVIDTAEKAAVAQRALNEAQSFVDLTQKLEKGREVAHADVVKADLSLQQRRREFADATLAAEKARLDLGVLLFPDPRTPYTLADQNQTPAPLPDEATVQAAAAQNNPDLRGALSAVRAAQNEVWAARLAYLPTIGLNYTYGINAPELAANSPGGVRNLGYSASVTVNVPLWDWFATQNKVRQSQLRERAVQATLTNTQRLLIAQLDEYYGEARVAADQVASLQTSVDTARESLHLTRLRYSAGEALALEVVDAQNQLAQAETALADGRLRAEVARANLQTLTGVLSQ